MNRSKDTFPVRVRFAPSPTGRNHIGGARTAIYNYLLARQSGGQFILRIEDTDQKRYHPDAEAELIEGLKWLGLSWDEGPDIGGPHAPYRQSMRKTLYQDIAGELVENGHAYPCFCTPKRLAELRSEQQKLKVPVRYDGRCRRLAPETARARVDAGESHVIRFKMPHDGTITVHDRLRGDITFENKNLDDYILVKSDGLALYHLAAIVDDHLMKITHVLRSAEWLPTFPLHAQIYRALEWDEPEWVHLSVFLKPSGKGKMSKREDAQYKDGGHSIYVTDLEQLGYLPEATVNWVALMGWSFDDQTEFFTMQDLIEKFNLDRLNPAPAAINFSKLDHFDGLHIRRLSIPDLAERLKPFFEMAGYTVDEERLLKVVPIIQERIVTLEDAPKISGFFFQDEVHPKSEELIGKNLTPGESWSVLSESKTVLTNLPDFHAETTESAMRALVDRLGLSAGQVFSILRVATTGQQVSPPLFESMEILGRQKTIQRIDIGMDLLRQLDVPGSV